MTQVKTQTNNTITQPLIGCNCFTVDSMGVHTGIRVEDGLTRPVVYIGRREPNNGWERFVQLSEDKKPVVSEGFLRHAALGVMPDNPKGKILFGTDPKSAPPFAIVKIETGRADIRRTKVDHGLKAQNTKAIIAESGTLRSRNGEVVSKEALVAIADGGTFGILFWDGSTAVLRRSGNMIRFRKFGSKQVRSWYEERLRILCSAESSPKRQDWGWHQRIALATLADDLESLGNELLEVAVHGGLRPGVVRGFHTQCEKRGQLSISLWFGEELRKVPRCANGEGFGVNNGVKNCAGEDTYKTAGGDTMFTHPRNPSAGQRKRTCKGKLSKHMSPEQIAARRAAKKAAAKQKKGKKEQPASA